MNKKYALLGGALIVCAMLIFYLSNYYPWYNYEQILQLVSIILILSGIIIIVIGYRKKNTSQIASPKGEPIDQGKKITNKYVVVGVVLNIIGILIFYFGRYIYLGILYQLFPIMLFIGVVMIVIGYRQTNTNKTVPPKIEPIEQEKEIKIRCMKCGFLNSVNAKYCSECGLELAPVRTRYCMHCGTKMSINDNSCPKCGLQPPSGVDVKICPNCNSVIPNQAKFCGDCGAKQP